jgi:hypothetical protein
MQAIDDSDRPPPEAELKPDECRTPFDEIILQYLARREIWLLLSVVLAPLALGLGVAGIWLTNHREARLWTPKYLRLGAWMTAVWVALFCVVHYWPEKPHPLVVTAQGQRMEALPLPGQSQPLLPREGFEWVRVRVTLDAQVPKGGRVNPRFSFRYAWSQFRLVTPTKESVPVSRDTGRLGREALPESGNLHMGERAQGVLLFHVKALPPATRLLYEADPDPKTREPRYVREFEIPPGAVAAPASRQAPESSAPAQRDMPGASSPGGGGAVQPPTVSPMPGSGRL